MSLTSHHLTLSDIAVIVAAKNEEKNIEKCIESILVSAQGKTEVLVVNDGSTDQTLEILRKFRNQIRVFSTDGVGPSISRNLALDETPKPYVAFADADCQVDPNWLTELIMELESEDLIYANIGGSQETHPDAKGWDRFHSLFMKCIGFVSDYVHDKEYKIEVKHNPTCNVLYRKDTIKNIGGFDPKLWPCEDLDLDIRLAKQGAKFFYTPKAVIYHHRPDSFYGFMKMMFRYGFGHAQLVKKYGPCQMIHWLPALLLVCSALLMWQPSRIWIGYLVAIKAFLVFIRLMFRSKSLLRAISYEIYLIPTVISWNVGFFVGLFQKKKITVK